MHGRISYLYQCDCEDCKESPERFNLAVGTKIKGVLNAGEMAFKKLHEKGSYKPEDLKNEKEYQDLIKKTFDVFNFAITDNDMPEAMTRALQSDAYLLSSLKANAQLFEASKLLLKDDGSLKSFSELSNDFDKLNIQYNQNYLDSEYQFAVSSSQSAAKWLDYGSSDRYNLQYRTAQDDRVRAAHRALAEITLPKEDAFWASYMPPNGFKCRCTTVEVLKDKYDVSDSEKAIAAGEKATTEIGKDGKNRLEIFRFNPGAEKVVFPPKHPYNKVVGAKEVKAAVNSDPKHTPSNISDYEKKFGVKVDRSFFKLLNRETTLTEKNLDKRVRSKGAYYHPTMNYVRIAYDERKKNSKWNAQSIIYHEFGHAADWQNGFKKQQPVIDLMKKYRSIFSEDKNAKFIELDKKVQQMSFEAHKEKNHDKSEQVGAAADTIMSLNSTFGYGHSQAYFRNAGNSAAEFLAHTFENKFIGNEVFKELMPELYDEMIKLVDQLEVK